MKVSAPHRGWPSGRATPSLRPNPYAAETANPAGRHLSFAEICPDDRGRLCHRPAKSRVCQSFFYKMPHLIERDHHQLSLERGLGKFASFVPNPVQNCNIADAENACDGAEAHVAHGVEKQGQRLHRRRLATRRRHGEIAAARKAMIPLKAPHNSIFHVIRSAATLAANLAHHGGLLLRSPPRVCYRNG